MTFVKTISVVLAVVAVLVGAYFLYWLVAGDSTDRLARINQQTYQRQNALVEQILDDITEAQDTRIPAAQRLALIDQVCDSAAKLTGSIALPQSASTFIALECDL